MTINYSKQVLLKRGNTAVSSTYTGPVGEITLDTDLLQLRVHDGTTQGGWVIPSGQDFINIQSNLAVIANVDISLLANVSTLLANANSQQTQINTLITNLDNLVTIGNIAPSTPNETFWFNDSDGRLYIKQGGIWTDASPTVLPSPSYIFGTLENTAGNIIPDATDTYSLGSADAQWKDLWVSNATIYLNSVPLGVDVTGNLTYNGNPLVSYVDGNLTVGGNIVSGGGATDRITDGYYSVVTDNTGIHLNAGSVSLTYDDNDQITFTGMNPTVQFDNNFVLHSPGYNKTWIFNYPGQTIIPGTLTGTDYLAMSSATFTDLRWYQSNPTVAPGLRMHANVGTSSDGVEIQTRWLNNSTQDTISRWRFDYNGTLTMPDNATITQSGFYAGSGQNAVLGQSDGNTQVYTTQTGVGIQSYNGGTYYTWGFDNTGKLTTPGKVLVDDVTNSISTSTGALVVSGGTGIAGDVHIGGTLNITDTTPSTDYTTGALVVNGGVGVNGNINLTGNINILSGNINIQEFTGSTGNFYGDITTGFNAFYAGKTGFTPLPFTVAQFSTNSNSYSQINMENISTGKLASVDFVGTGDIGDDADWFFDIGIANSGYDPVLAAENNAPGTVIGPLDAYYYVQGNTSVPDVGGNLAIGTSQVGKAVKLFAGGVNAANIIATVSETGVVLNRGNLTFGDGTVQTTAFDPNSVTPVQITNLTVQNTIQGNISGFANITAANVTAALGYTPTLYSDSNVAAYLPSSLVITGINANVTAANAAIVTANTAMKSYVDAANAALTSNAAAQANQIAAANAAIVTANTAMKSYVDTQIASIPGGGSTYSDSNVAAYLVANPQPGTYSNTNVAAYLTGNVTVGNVRSTNGYFWSNGVAYAGTYGNTQVAQYLTGTIAVGNINLGTSVRLNGTTQTIDTANGSAITFASRLNLTGSGAGYGLVVNNPAQFASNLLVQGIGGISIPNRPAFRIYGGTPAWWTTANTNLKGGSITVDYNQGGYFNSGTGVFTAPIYGLYQVTLNARVGSNNGTNQILVLKNGLNTAGNAIMMWESDTNTGTAVHYGVSTVVRLNAGDFLTANITAGNVQFDQNDSWTVTYIG
jgi:hypothetical protein